MTRIGQWAIGLIGCFMASCLGLLAQGRPLHQPIGNDVWQVAEQPSAGITDAVVLEDVVRLYDDRIERFQRVRIFSRRGQEAFGVLPLGQNVLHLEGRVIEADGTETAIDPETDVAELLVYRFADTEQKYSFLTPPGLTNDCVLEVTWHEAAEKGLPKDSFMRPFAVPGPFFIKEKRFEFSTKTIMRLSSTLFSDQIVDIVTRFYWDKIPPPAKFKQSVHDGFTVLTYSDVPAMKDHPFGSMRRDDGMAVVQVFRTFPFEAKSVGGFWDSFGTAWVSVWFDFYQKKSKSYARFVRGVAERLPDRGPAGAKIALAAFHQRIQRADLMSPTQMAGMLTRDLEPIPFNDDLVLRAFQRGYAFSHNIGIAFFWFMRDLGFEPLLIFGPPNTEAHFDEREFNPFALDLPHPVFGIREAPDSERMLLLSPSDPGLSAGMVPAHLHGRRLLTIDPFKDWKHRFIALPHRPWQDHQQLYRLVMSLGEEGHWQMLLRQRFTGYFDAELRETLLPLAALSQTDVMADTWQKRLPHWRLDDTKVLNMTSDDEVEVRLRAVSRLPLQPDWAVVDPFPGVPPLLTVPDIWPSERRQPVVLSSNMGQVAQAEIRLPKGWQLRGNPSWQRENTFGTVSFKAWQKDERVLVERRVVVSTCEADADAEPALRNFLTWMTMADAQTVALDRGGQP